MIKSDNPNRPQRSPTLIRNKTVGQKTSVVISVSGGGYFCAVHQVYDGIDWSGINYLESETTWSDEQGAIGAHEIYLGQIISNSHTQIDRSI
jgi:hypothetical protein